MLLTNMIVSLASSVCVITCVELVCYFILWQTQSKLRHSSKEYLKSLNIESTHARFWGEVIRSLVLFIFLQRRTAPYLKQVLGLPEETLLNVTAMGGILVGYAAQDTISNFVAGVLLVFTRPFKAGDTVIIGSVKGYIVGVGFFQTHMNTLEHTRHVIPNSKVYKESLYNLSHLQAICVKVCVSTPREFDVNSAQYLLLKVANLTYEEERKSHSMENPTSGKVKCSEKEKLKTSHGIDGPGRNLDSIASPTVVLSCISKDSLDWTVSVWGSSKRETNIKNSLLFRIAEELQIAQVGPIYEHFIRESSG